MNVVSYVSQDTSGSFAAPPGPIEQVRYACALGALTSVIAIEGAIPITHCGPGCASKQFHALSGISGYQGGEFQHAGVGRHLVELTREAIGNDCIPA